MVGPVEETFLLGEDPGRGQGPVGGGFGDGAAVAPQPDPVGDGRRDVDHPLDCELAGEPIDHRRRPRRRPSRWEARAAATSRTISAGRHVDCRSVKAASAASTVRSVSSAACRPSAAWRLTATSSPSTVMPTSVSWCRQMSCSSAGSIGHGLVGRLSSTASRSEPPPLPPGRLPAQSRDEPVELHLHPVADVPVRDRERLQDLVGDAGDLGDAVLPVAPGDTGPGRQLGPQSGVVQRGEGALVDLDPAGVEREPATVVGTDPVGDHDMRVELWVHPSRRVLTERRRHDAPRRRRRRSRR